MSQSEFTILLPSGGTETCLHTRKYTQYQMHEVVNFIIRPIAVADITLAFCVEASVRLEVSIVLVAQPSHSLYLLNSPKWYGPNNTICVGAVLLLYHSRVDMTKTFFYLSDIVPCAVPLCL